MKLSPIQFKENMQMIADQHGLDPEIAHCKMDDLICTVLIELGYGEGIQIFSKQIKWYE